MLQDSSPDREHKIVTAVKSGDWSAFEQLVANYSSELIRLAYAIIQHPADAEDATQDVFLWVWANRESWNPAGSLRLYLLRAVGNRARDIKQKRDNRLRLESLHIAPSARPDFQVTDLEVGDAELWKAIAKLPERWREGVMLRFVEGLSFADIGTVMGISEDAAKKLVRRALVALRGELG